MRNLALFICLVALSLEGCGETEPKKESEADRPPPGVQEDKKETRTDPNQRQERKKSVLTGEVSCGGASDAGPGEVGKLSLRINTGDKISGDLSIGDSVMTLSGIRESNNIRLWVSGSNTNLEASRHGYMFGEVSGDGYAGAVAVSGNGGEPKKSCKWKTDGVFLD